MEQIESKRSIIAEYYTAHYDELQKFVASRLLFAEDAEDVVQNIFVRLLQMDKMITPSLCPVWSIRWQGISSMTIGATSAR